MYMYLLVTGVPISHSYASLRCHDYDPHLIPTGSVWSPMQGKVRLETEQGVGGRGCGRGLPRRAGPIQEQW